MQKKKICRVTEIQRKEDVYFTMHEIINICVY